MIKLGIKRTMAGLGALALLASAASALAREPVLYVYSTIDALLAGSYDGELTVQQLGTHGDFGIGTYNHLDGEMVLLDGVSYHVKADGTVVVAPPADKVPLAYVLPFKPAQRIDVAADPAEPAGKRMTDLEAMIDARMHNPNLFYAVKVTGEFAGVSTRAIPPQVRPYKPLAEASKDQVIFKRDAVAGTLVGLRSPGFSKGISVPGWHWHFISADKAYGGHVLAGALLKGEVQIAAVHDFEVALPTNDDFAQVDQAKDRSVELHQVEGDRR